jgi:hypothetical protein
MGAPQQGFPTGGGNQPGYQGGNLQNLLALHQAMMAQPGRMSF